MKKPKTKDQNDQKMKLINYRLKGMGWFRRGMEKLESKYKFLLVAEVAGGVVILILGLLMLVS